jgi:hypothetical protein
MTEYEIAILAATNTSILQAQGSIIQAQGTLVVETLTLYYSLLFGYLLAAYAIGKKLTTIQTVVLTMLYLAAVTYNRFYGFIVLKELFVLENKMNEMLGTTATPVQVMEQEGMLIFVSTFVIISILASLYFMWSIRHSREE